MPALIDEDRTEALVRIERAIDSIHLSIQDIRNFIFGLRPELLEGASLIGGLAALADEFRHNTMIDLELQVAGPVSEPGADATGQLLAIVGEALSNVARHSGATRATIRVSGASDGTPVDLSIEDNGHGFDPARVGKLGHQGLPNIRERAARIGATIRVDSAVGRGTQIVIGLDRAQPQGATGARA